MKRGRTNAMSNKPAGKRVGRIAAGPGGILLPVRDVRRTGSLSDAGAIDGTCT